mmetsp:Transcript_20420/g.42508  ORF Transcript_20420/g.42508 Transcript_20420/m.42508 type:complete len:532 (-) Transcript_20420:27-1622(-)
MSDNASSVLPPAMPPSTPVRSTVIATEAKIKNNPEGTSARTKSQGATDTAVQEISSPPPKYFDESALDSFGIPKTITHHEIRARYKTASVFILFRELTKVFKWVHDFDSSPPQSSQTLQVGGKKGISPESKPKAAAKVQSPAKRNARSSKSFSNICLLCMKTVRSLPNPPPNAWTAALCNVNGKSTNAEKHLKTKHAKEPEVVEYFIQKEKKKQFNNPNGIGSSTSSISEASANSHFPFLCEENNSNQPQQQGNNENDDKDPVPQIPKPRRFLLARHGETNFNKEHRVQGTLDESVLTYDGIAQASKLGVKLARLQSEVNLTTTCAARTIIRCWCSPLHRCRQTFAAVSGCCAAYQCPLPQPKVHWDLREIHFCQWQGKLRRQVALEDEHNWNVFKSAPHKLTLKGEFAPVVECWERGLKNWEIIRADATNLEPKNSPESVEASLDTNFDGAVFIMCHGGIGQAMLLQALGLDIEMYGKSRRYALDNCDCIEFEWMDGENLCNRWRRIHPTETPWVSRTTKILSGELSCSR